MDIIKPNLHGNNCFVKGNSFHDINRQFPKKNRSKLPFQLWVPALAEADPVDEEDVKEFVEDFKQLRENVGYSHKEVSRLLTKACDCKFSEESIRRFECKSYDFQTMSFLKNKIQKWLETERVEFNRPLILKQKVVSTVGYSLKKRSVVEADIKNFLEIVYRSQSVMMPDQICYLSNFLMIEMEALETWFADRLLKEKRNASENGVADSSVFTQAKDSRKCISSSNDSGEGESETYSSEEELSLSAKHQLEIPSCEPGAIGRLDSFNRTNFKEGSITPELESLSSSSSVESENINKSADANSVEEPATITAGIENCTGHDRSINEASLGDAMEKLSVRGDVMKDSPLKRVLDESTIKSLYQDFIKSTDIQTFHECSVGAKSEAKNHVHTVNNSLSSFNSFPLTYESKTSQKFRSEINRTLYFKDECENERPVISFGILNPKLKAFVPGSSFSFDETPSDLTRYLEKLSIDA